MQLTERDAWMIEWLRGVRIVEMTALRWALGGLSGAGSPVSLRKAQQWVARCREAGLVTVARPIHRSGSVVWASQDVTGRADPSLLRQTVRHDLAVSAVSARYLCAGWDWTPPADVGKGDHNPDGTATRGTMTEHVEIELTDKGPKRYLSKFRALDQRLQHENITGIVYITDHRTAPAIERAIRERVLADERHRFTVIPALDIWGKIEDTHWPTDSHRFVPLPQTTTSLTSSDIT